MSKLPGPVIWFGGKGHMVAKLLPLIPYSKIYCEPFFGAGSIFWNRQPSPVEIINDLDKRLINLFRVLQSPRQCAKLQRRLAATLCSYGEFCKAFDTLKDDAATDIDKAWAFYTAQNQGFSGVATCRGNWSRAFVSNRGMAGTSSRWWSRFDHFPAWHQRIARAQIDSRDALQVIEYWDSPDTTFYLDPPYALETRVKGSRDVYHHEQDNDFHARLVDLILHVKGAVVLSGYNTPIYAPLDDAGWDRIEFQTVCYAAGKTRGSGLQGAGSAMDRVPRTEIIWQNKNAIKLLKGAELYDFRTHRTAARGRYGTPGQLVFPGHQHGTGEQAGSRKGRADSGRTGGR